MLRRIFHRPRSGAPAEPTVDGESPIVPQGVRIYVVGDVHGRLDLLLMMERLIRVDIAESGRHPECLLVHLGDFVDRGFDSRRVLDHLVRSRADGLAPVYLVGNHDLWLRQFARGEDLRDEAVASWLRFGGDATLLSYGVKLDLRQPEKERFASAFAQLQQLFPPEHAEFLDRLEPAFGLGDYFFCHAGIRPEVPLGRQTEADLLWIREPFLSWTGSCGKIVVHGHTVDERPTVRSNRIGIDTGACWTGRLTCLVLEGATRRFLQTGR